MALKSGLLTSGDSSIAERDHSLEKLNKHKLEIDQLKKLILEKVVAMKTMSTYFLDTEKKGTTI